MCLVRSRRTLLARGWKAYRRGDLEEALRLARADVEERGQNDDNQSLMGSIRLAQGDVAGWMEQWVDPLNERQNMLLRLVKATGTDHQIPVLWDAIERFPEESFWWHMLGVLLTEGDPDAAVDALRQAIQLSETESAPRTAFLIFWRRWIRRGPEAVHYRMQLAKALEKSGRPVEALKEWEYIYEVARQRRTYGDSRKTKERARKRIVRLKERLSEVNGVVPS